MKNGQFDGASNYQVEYTGNFNYLAILNNADYDGIEEVGITRFLENGEGISIAGDVLPIEIQLLNAQDISITGITSTAQVFVSRTLAADNDTPGTDVDTEWVLLSDNNVGTFGDTEMRFDPIAKSLIIDWLTPAEETDDPVTFDVNGVWYGRIVFSDNTIVNNQIESCLTTSAE